MTFELIFREGDVKQNLSGDYEVTLKIPKQQRSTVNSLYSFLRDNRKELAAKIAVKRGKRSQDANAYLWVLCSKLADAMNSTKEEVYVELVRQVGRSEIVPVRDDALEFWLNAWKSKGLGWHAEPIGKARNFEGYTNTINYYGSSVYDTKDMTILIDHTVEEAKRQGIETLPPDEINRLKAEWR